jgi:hypothetical protein
MVNGKLIFVALGDHLYSDVKNPFNPTSTIWPSKISMEKQEKVANNVEKILQKAGYHNGPVNIEVCFDASDNIYIMGIGARNGGHFVPQAITRYSGFDLIGNTIRNLAGKPLIINNNKTIPTFYYAIHSLSNGILKEILINKELETLIVEKTIYVEQGSKIQEFSGSNASLGIILASCDDYAKLQHIFFNIENYINATIELHQGDTLYKQIDYKLIRFILPPNYNYRRAA